MNDSTAFDTVAEHLTVKNRKAIPSPRRSEFSWRKNFDVFDDRAFVRVGVQSQSLVASEGLIFSLSSLGSILIFSFRFYTAETFQKFRGNKGVTVTPVRLLWWEAPVIWKFQKQKEFLRFQWSYKMQKYFRNWRETNDSQVNRFVHYLSKIFET